MTLHAPCISRLASTSARLIFSATATQKRHYYYMSPLGRRLFQLGLGGVNLSFVGVSGKEDILLIDQFIQRYGETWPAEWLRSRGFNDWADHWLRLPV